MSNTTAYKIRNGTSLSTLLIGVLVLCLLGCERPPASGAKEIPEHTRQELLIGYDLLADILADESRLGTLELFKTLMLDPPNHAIGKMMDALSDTSKRRAAELSKLRHLAPDVSEKPTTQSPIYDAIAALTKEAGKSELLSRTSGFDVRFVLVQAQAFRMVSAIATANMRFDPNPERKVFLRDLAREYEGCRGDLIKYLGGKQAEK